MMRGQISSSSLTQELNTSTLAGSYTDSFMTAKKLWIEFLYVSWHVDYVFVALALDVMTCLFVLVALALDVMTC